MSKTEKIVAVKGMNDILPTDSHLWQLFENTAQSVVQSYGFQQIRTPIVEDTALFKRSPHPRRERPRVVSAGGARSGARGRARV